MAAEAALHRHSSSQKSDDFRDSESGELVDAHQSTHLSGQGSARTVPAMTAARAAHSATIGIAPVVQLLVRRLIVHDRA